MFLLLLLLTNACNTVTVNETDELYRHTSWNSQHASGKAKGDSVSLYCPQWRQTTDVSTACVLFVLSFQESKYDYDSHLSQNF